jgi:hypothetical protein
MPREEQPAPKQQARKPSGDGHNAPAAPAPSSAPAQTWAQKIDAAKAQLDRYAEASEQTWSDARAFVLERTETWPETHRREVLEHIKRISGDRGEIPEPENVEPVEFR